MISDPKVIDKILELCRERGIGKTICPSEVARALEPDLERWRSHLPSVRARAAELAEAGQIAIYRKGRAIEPSKMKGVIRLGLPKST
ncbi:MAG: DUF3253 domain-containing protein [Pseudomonadota bacterium]